MAHFLERSPSDNASIICATTPVEDGILRRHQFASAAIRPCVKASPIPLQNHRPQLFHSLLPPRRTQSDYASSPESARLKAVRISGWPVAMLGLIYRRLLHGGLSVQMFYAGKIPYGRTTTFSLSFSSRL